MWRLLQWTGPADTTEECTATASRPEHGNLQLKALTSKPTKRNNPTSHPGTIANVTRLKNPATLTPERPELQLEITLAPVLL